jgi:Oxidoreductase family, NAD-binding Rossmann fold/KduI/IolB family
MGRRHAENLRSLVPEGRLVAVADVDFEAARRFADELEVPHYFDTVEALVERNDVEAVVIASPSKVMRDGYHPVVAGHGYNVYYLNCLAGSARLLLATRMPTKPGCALHGIKST